MSEKFKISGVVHSVGMTVQISDKFKKREFVVEIDRDGKYPQLVQFQLAQDKCGLIDGARRGSDVTVHFNLRGRQWTDPKSGEVKTFNTLDAWKIESEQASENVDDEANDLPF